MRPPPKVQIHPLPSCVTVNRHRQRALLPPRASRPPQWTSRPGWRPNTEVSRAALESCRDCRRKSDGWRWCWHGVVSCPVLARRKENLPHLGAARGADAGGGHEAQTVQMMRSRCVGAPDGVGGRKPSREKTPNLHLRTSFQTRTKRMRARRGEKRLERRVDGNDPDSACERMTRMLRWSLSWTCFHFRLARMRNLCRAKRGVVQVARPDQVVSGHPTFETCIAPAPSASG